MQVTPVNFSAASFALLDDSGAHPGEPCSRLYTELVRTLACHTASELGAMLEAMQQGLADGLQAVGLFEYELGTRLHQVQVDPPNPRPLVQILLFSRCERLTSEQVDQWLQQRDSGAPAGVACVRASVDQRQFDAAIARIHAYIEAGDTYQTNYTYRLRFDAYGEPLALYRRLRARQPVPYGALIVLPDGGAVLSLSPELFVRHTQGRLTARPMKGTAAASGEPAVDAERAAQLAADPKNRAENLMIVDLLRNDLGRVARVGSVVAPRLFSVERFSGVLQMTSTVEADLQPALTLAQVIQALYPCGSITGAPKRRTMQIIDQLEPDPRGLYTGALGWFEAAQEGRRIGDFCLSVPIRTVVLQAPDGGIRRGELGVGAGIVHDSVASEEHAECQLKARFLTGLGSQFSLFETIYATRADGCRHLELHMNRLRTSAAYFGFRFDEPFIRAELARCCADLDGAMAHRLRLALEPDGSHALQSAPLASLRVPVRLHLAQQAMRSDDLFLRHKTTVRGAYDAAWKAAERQGGFDMLFTNERGELTEGGRSSLFIRLDGHWVTPPLAAGVLPGVMRTVLLNDPAWNASERRLTHADLRLAEAVVACNALRGPLPAEIVWDEGLHGGLEPASA